MPYKANQLASPRFSEPIVNTPKSITVLTKEILQDKNATTLKDAARTTAGITMGTGEGGNAFGDRFFIRGFDVRNDVFIDGVRDPGVSVRENFFTEQVEILRGPASSYAGRGTAGGAINIVTKQAGDRNFYKAETTFGTDHTKRLTLDINQVINPTLSIRAGALIQNANVAGRNYINDDRKGAFAALKWTPVENFKFTANYIHSELEGLPDFGVPYYRPSTLTAGVPFPERGVSRNNFYGFINRDFQKVKQDIATANGEYRFNENVTISNKFRVQQSLLNYVGTLPEAPVVTNTNPALWTLSANPQSRYQKTDVVANQTDVTVKYETGPWKNTTVAGVELSREKVYLNSYTGLASEALPGGFSGTGALTGVNIFNPQFTNLPFNSSSLALTGNPTNIPIDTKSAYVIHTTNYRDFIILNGGIRYDDYSVRSSNNLGSVSAHDGIPNYNLGITVKPLPYASVYAAYATSANPVGAEVDGTSVQYGGLAPFLAGSPPQIFGPERNKAAEIGTKWELFNGRLLATAALFQTEKTNARESATVNGVARVTLAGAAYRVRGIDLSVGGKLTDDWSVFGGLVLMESEVTKSNIAAANTALYATNVDRPLANVAHQSFNLLTKYQITPMFEIGGQATYVSKIYGGTFLAANQGTEIPAHWRFDTFLEAKLTQNFTAKLFVNNIFNTTYYDGLYQSAAPFVLVAPGRSASLVVSAKF